MEGGGWGWILVLCHEEVLNNEVMWSLVHVLEQLHRNGMRPEAERSTKRSCHDGRVTEGDGRGGPEYPQQAAGGARAEGRGCVHTPRSWLRRPGGKAGSRMGRRTERREQ